MDVKVLFWLFVYFIVVSLFLWANYCAGRLNDLLDEDENINQKDELNNEDSNDESFK